MSINEPTLGMLRECNREHYPICLKNALTNIFGNGDAALTLLPKTASSQYLVLDLWKTYFDFIDFAETRFGEEVASVIEEQVMKEIEALGCTQCPVYELPARRSHKR
jgi:hypothetical protein